MRQHDFASPFYGSQPWKDCRRSYTQSVGGLCERCLSKGLIVTGDSVHHKIKLTPQNIGDPLITLNWDNLILLCDKCHSEMHKSERRWKVDSQGRLISPISSE